MRKKLLTLTIILAKEIQYMLEAQNYLPGDKLPSERILAEAFHVQRLTIREALNELIQEGVIISQERKGYFLAKPRIIKSVNLFSENPVIEDPHIKYKIHKLEEIQANDKLAGKLMLPVNTPLHRIVRLCMEDKTTVGIETSYILKEVLPVIEKKDLEHQSVARLLQRSAQHGVAGSNHKITLVYANDTESRLMEIEAGTPVMKQKCLVYDNKGQLLLYSENIMLINRFVFLRKEAR
jgi:GntR family transcriptional regulator